MTRARHGWISLRGIVLLALGCCVNNANAQIHDQHLGVASCAGSTCHGSTKPLTVHGITQDEYFTWQRQDRHAQAYNTLLSERSRGIAQRLGWNAAEQAPGCLACHADAVPAKLRGERFQLTDGIGCEACHGGSERWLSSHVQGYKSARETTAHGLVPLWDPRTRATVCGACHQGDATHPMTHDIMAAGHPPLVFELDTFTALQPAHYTADADYVARKGGIDSAQTWLVGQVVSAQLYLDQLARPPKAGMFPELALFDCNACHHSMFAGRAAPARTPGASRGVVPLADASLLVVGHWLAGANDALASGWEAQRRGLYESVTAGDRKQLAGRAASMRKFLADRVLPRAQAQTMDAAQIRAVLAVLLEQAAQPLRGDFSHAEQTAMGASVLLGALQRRGALEIDSATQKSLDDVYAAIKDRDRFNQDSYAAAVAQLKTRISAQ